LGSTVSTNFTQRGMHYRIFEPDMTKINARHKYMFNSHIFEEQHSIGWSVHPLVGKSVCSELCQLRSLMQDPLFPAAQAATADCTYIAYFAAFY
jgi:hypothetical protein